ncbi:MAG: phosphate acyltransferase PlsX [Pseudomonadales bacterium]
MAVRPRIAVDAMGGDGGPEITVPAARLLTERADLVLVGDPHLLAPLLGDAPIPVVAASQVITDRHTLGDILRRLPDASMRRALELLAGGQVDAVVSGGDTAALMALSRQCLSMIPGIERPAICKTLQGKRAPFWMLDLGANLECSPAQLVQFARMGSLLAERVGDLSRPRVALLNIGTERRKGPETLRRAAELLSADAMLNYVGYIEGNVLFDNVADVIVCDGFTGNIALKAVEGAASMAGHLLGSLLSTLNPVQKLGLALSRDALRSLGDGFNPQRYNGASFVGLNGVVIKSHGSADSEGFKFAIEAAIVETAGQIPARLGEQFDATHAGAGVQPAAARGHGDQEYEDEHKDKDKDKGN